VWNKLKGTKKTLQPGMVVYIYNPSTWGAEQEDCEFKVILCYTVRLCLEKKRKKEKEITIYYKNVDFGKFELHLKIRRL
jgi:hypothetical protein